MSDVAILPKGCWKREIDGVRHPDTVVGRPCYWCKRPMESKRLKYGIDTRSLAATKDHLVPKSRGGKKKVWACFRCNSLKGDMMPEEWETWMKEHPDFLDWDF